MQTTPDQRFFRLVIGCYQLGERHKCARDELLTAGLSDQQLCSFGYIGELKKIFDQHKYYLRHVRELEICVSPTDLFDVLWPAPYFFDGNLTSWMTNGQSNTIWNNLCKKYTCLMINNKSDKQVIQSSQILLKYDPATLQTYNFLA